MGGIISTFVGISLDAIVGSATGVLCEYIFSDSYQIENKWMAGFEGLLELTLMAVVAEEVSSLVKPKGYSRPYGVVFMMYFALLAAKNLRFKIGVLTEAIKFAAALPSGGLYSKIGQLGSAPRPKRNNNGN